MREVEISQVAVISGICAHRRHLKQDGLLFCNFLRNGQRITYPDAILKSHIADFDRSKERGRVCREGSTCRGLLGRCEVRRVGRRWALERHGRKVFGNCWKERTQRTRNIKEQKRRFEAALNILGKLEKI